MSNEKVLKKMKKSHVPRKKIQLLDDIWEILTKDINLHTKKALWDFLTNNTQSIQEISQVTKYTETQEYKNNSILRELVQAQTMLIFEKATVKKEYLFPGTRKFNAIMWLPIKDCGLPNRVLHRLLGVGLQMAEDTHPYSEGKLKCLRFNCKIEDLYNCDYDDLEYIVGIGPVALGKIQAFFESKHIIWPKSRIH